MYFTVVPWAPIQYTSEVLCTATLLDQNAIYDASNYTDGETKNYEGIMCYHKQHNTKITSTQASLIKPSWKY